MQSGLLWFDNSTQYDFAVKVQDAARRYQEKFGVEPDTCYVNPDALKQGEITVRLRQRTLRVVPFANIMPDHFWIGVDEEDETDLR